MAMSCVRRFGYRRRTRRGALSTTRTRCARLMTFGLAPCQRVKQTPRPHARSASCSACITMTLQLGALRSGEYEVLELPMHFEAGRRSATSLEGLTTASTGDLLWSDRYAQAELDKLKAEIGHRAYEAQFQQRSGKPGGTIFKSALFKCWSTDAARPTDGILCASWDCSFREARILITSQAKCGFAQEPTTTCLIAYAGSGVLARR